MGRIHTLIGIFAGAAILTTSPVSSRAATNEYQSVDKIFSDNCLDCHSANDPDGKLVLETFESLMQGGESGAVVTAGKSTESLLVRMIEGRVERDGKKKIMPPGKRDKLSEAEIAAIKAWIDAGAHGPPAGTIAAKEINAPKITPTVPPRRAIVSIARSPDGGTLAEGTYGEIELLPRGQHLPARKLSGLRGNVNALLYSPDGAYLYAAGGLPGVSGEARQWKIADGSVTHVFAGHKDAIYAAALSPDGKILATGSYDQKIKLWDTTTGAELKTLSGHNGAVYSLDFRHDGKILASASADRTVKLWDVATGERRDTLSQSLRELYAVAFSPDGHRLVAGGVDNRIRIWSISESAAETTNPLLDAKYAHEGAILNLVFSPDGRQLLSTAEDRTVKMWDGQTFKEQWTLAPQPDWARAILFMGKTGNIAIGRMDGSVEIYDAATGEKLTMTTAANGSPIYSQK